MLQLRVNITPKYCQKTRYNYVGNSGFLGLILFFSLFSAFVLSFRQYYTYRTNSCGNAIANKKIKLEIAYYQSWWTDMSEYYFYLFLSKPFLVDFIICCFQFLYKRLIPSYPSHQMLSCCFRHTVREIQQCQLFLGIYFYFYAFHICSFCLFILLLKALNQCMQFDFFALSTTLIDTAKLQLLPDSLYRFVTFCVVLCRFVPFCVVFLTSDNGRGGAGITESRNYGGFATTTELRINGITELRILV